MSEPWRNWSTSQTSQRGTSYNDRRYPTANPEVPPLKMGALKAIIPRNEPHGLANPPEVNGNPEITQCTVVGSYNSTEAKNPTILVPGKPPRWSPFAIQTALAQDKGQYFRDHNAARFPSHPLEPALRAIFAQDPEFDTSSVDIVSCRSSLGFLLDFLRNVSRRRFRIVIEIVGSTAFFVRRENSPTEVTPGVRGYGHVFPQVITQWDPEVRGSESHQRIVKYDFAGLSCIVRYGVDAYIAESPGTMDMHNSAMENMTAMFEATGLDSHVSDQQLTVKDGGQVIPQSSILEITTRSILSKHYDHLSELIPRLWLSQIANVVLAFHEYGLFADVSINNVSDKVKQWQTDNRVLLYIFAGLLRRLIDFARKQPDGRIEVVREESSDRLELRAVENDVERMLPESLGKRWVSGLDEASSLSGTEESEDVDMEGDEDEDEYDDEEDDEYDDEEADEEDDDDSNCSYYRGGFGSICLDLEDEYDLDYIRSTA